MSIIAVHGIFSDKRELKSRVLVPGEIPGMWPEIEPNIERALENSWHEISTSGIFRALIQGGMTAIVAERGETVEMVCILELAEFPEYSVVFVVAVGGKNLKLAARFMPAIESYALALGAREIRAFCRNDAMVRLIRRLRLPLFKAYTMLRWDLRGGLQ